MRFSASMFTTAMAYTVLSATIVTMMAAYTEGHSPVSDLANNITFQFFSQYLNENPYQFALQNLFV